MFFCGDMRHPSASPNWAVAVAASDASGVFNKNKGGISASLGSEEKHQAWSTPKRWGWLWQDGREHFGGWKSHRERWSTCCLGIFFSKTNYFEVDIYSIVIHTEVHPGEWSIDDASSWFCILVDGDCDFILSWRETTYLVEGDWLQRWGSPAVWWRFRHREVQIEWQKECQIGC